MARLVLGIDARPARQGAQEFDRATGRVTQSARQAAQATDRVGNSFQRLRPAVQAASGAFAALGGALAIRQLVRYADVATQLNSRLRLVTETSQELADIQRDIFNLSQETRTSLQSTTNLYVRLEQALQGTGIAQERVFQVTEAFNKALQLSGSTTAEAAAATQQFSQAIAGTVVRAEEFNSLIDASPRLIRALINELEGVDDVGALRQLLEDGELTRERVIEALTNALPRLRGEFERLDRTTSQAFTQLNNALITAIGNINEQSGATNALNDAIDSIREVVSDQQFQQAVANLTGNLVAISELSLGNLPELVRLYERLANALSFFGDAGLSPTGLPSLDVAGLLSGSGSSQNQAGRRFDLGPGASDFAQINEVLQFSNTIGVGQGGSGGPNVPTPGTRPDGGQAILREQEEARRAFAREQIQRVNRTSDLIAGQREELQRLGDSIRRDVITPVEEYRNRLENLNLALEANAINQDTYNRALDQAKEKLEEATGLTARYKTEIEFLEDVGERAFERIGRTITEEITKGTFAFEDLKNIGLSVVSELSQAFLRLALINPLKNAIFGGNSATLNSVGGLLGDLIGTGVASSGSGFQGVAAAIPAGSRASGGTVTEGRPYLVGERGPEIMVPGANGAVMPNGGGGKTEVNVYSSGGEEPEIRRSRNGNGGERIDVILDRKIQEAAASGKLDKPMRARYGINPSTGTR